MSEREREEAIGIAGRLWPHLEKKEWEAARALLAEDFEAVWPQSRERIVGPEDFIAVNREYPGSHNIQIQNHRYGYDQWKHVHEVSTVVRISSEMPDCTKSVLYGISFFEIERGGLVKSVVEYWADTYPAPEWRKQYVRTY